MLLISVVKPESQKEIKMPHTDTASLNIKLALIRKALVSNLMRKMDTQKSR